MHHPFAVVREAVGSGRGCREAAGGRVLLPGMYRKPPTVDQPHGRDGERVVRGWVTGMVDVWGAAS